jgi:hypothetical protein
MDAQNLTGVWSGFYSYLLDRRRGVSFTATLIDSGAISGTVHEQWSAGGPILFASVHGSRSGAAVQFIKTYDGGKPHAQPIFYEGLVDSEATAIEGRWKIAGNWSGKFLMTRSRAPEAAVEREVEAAV